MPERKTLNTKFETRIQVLCFRLSFLWRIPIWWSVKTKSLNVERNRNIWHFLEYWECHQSDEWMKIKSLLIELFSISQKCSMETLVGGILPVASEKVVFEYRNKSLLVKLFQTSSLCWKDRILGFLKLNHPLQTSCFPS